MWKYNQRKASTRPVIYAQVQAIDDAVLAEAMTSIRKEILGARHYQEKIGIWRMPIDELLSDTKNA